MNVAICAPLAGELEPRFEGLLLALLQYTLANRPDCRARVATRVGPLLDNRNALADAALQAGAEYILWLDSDMAFPPDTLIRLLSHSKQIVGCNYARRGEPTYPTAARRDARGERVYVWTTLEKAAAGAIEPIADMGLGVCLTSAEVYRHLALPYFRFEEAPNGRGVLGEDVLFFHAAAEAGFDVLLDHGLSWQIGHVDGDRIRTNADTIADKPAFHAAQAQRLNKELRRTRSA